jgi:hypothetical protein
VTPLTIAHVLSLPEWTPRRPPPGELRAQTAASRRDLYAARAHGLTVVTEHMTPRESGATVRAQIRGALNTLAATTLDAAIGPPEITGPSCGHTACTRRHLQDLAARQAVVAGFPDLDAAFMTLALFPRSRAWTVAVTYDRRARDARLS